MEVSGANWILHLLAAGVRSWLGQSGRLEDMPASDAEQSSCGQGCDAPRRGGRGRTSPERELQRQVTTVRLVFCGYLCPGSPCGGCWVRGLSTGRYREGMTLRRQASLQEVAVGPADGNRVAMALPVPK